MQLKLWICKYCTCGKKKLLTIFIRLTNDWKCGAQMMRQNPIQSFGSMLLNKKQVSEGTKTLFCTTSFFRWLFIFKYLIYLQIIRLVTV